MGSTGHTYDSPRVSARHAIRTALKALHWSELKELFLLSFQSWNQQKAPRLGASLAFYTLLSITPLLLVVVSIVGLVIGKTAAEGQIIREMQDIVGPAGVQAVRSVLAASHNTTHGVEAGIFGLLTLLFGASGVLLELQDALNTIWEVPAPSVSGNVQWILSFVKQRLFSFALVLAIGFVLLVSLALNAWVSALGKFSAGVLPIPESVLHFLDAFVSFAIISVLFAAIYKIMPDVHLQWHDVALGGIVTSLLFTIGKIVLGLYLGKASLASSYGAAASLVAFIIWVYYSSQIFFLGAEFTKVYAMRHGSRPEHSPAATQEAPGQSHFPIGMPKPSPH